MRLIVFHQTAFDDYSDWSKLDRKIFERVRRIIVEANQAWHMLESALEVDHQ